MHMVSNLSVSEEKINITHLLPLSPLSHLKTGGKALMASFPENENDVFALIEYAVANGLRYRAAGGLSNTLIPDEGFDGLIIMMTDMKGITISGSTLTAAAGETLESCIRTSLGNSLSGLEHFSGIPGTIGGALAVNAGADGAALSDYLLSAKVITRDGTLKRITREEGLFSYRSSNVRDDEVIVSVTLELEKCDDISPSLEKSRLLRRKRTQEGQYDHPSLGCVFRNPEGDSAGRIIDSLGLKGLTHGGACIAENHANFIVNTGTSTSSDYFSLAEEVRRTVLEKTGISLEYEIRFLK